MTLNSITNSGKLEINFSARDEAFIEYLESTLKHNLERFLDSDVTCVYGDETNAVFMIDDFDSCLKQDVKEIVKMTNNELRKIGK